MCGHVVCLACVDQLTEDQRNASPHCLCHGNDEGHAPEPGRAAPAGTSADPMSNVLASLKYALLVLEKDKATTPVVKSHMRTTSNLTFTAGSKRALQDLDLWLDEFDRTVAHVSNNQGLTAQDRIVYLVVAWPSEGEVGSVGRELNGYQL